MKLKQRGHIAVVGFIAMFVVGTVQSEYMEITNYETYSLPSKSITEFASIPMENLYNYEVGASGCEIIMDSAAFIACDNGYHVIESLKTFMSAIKDKLTEENSLVFTKKTPFMRTKGNSTSFLDPDTGKAKFLRNIKLNHFGVDEFAPSQGTTSSNV